MENYIRVRIACGSKRVGTHMMHDCVWRISTRCLFDRPSRWYINILAAELETKSGFRVENCVLLHVDGIDLRINLTSHVITAIANQCNDFHDAACADEWKLSYPTLIRSKPVILCGWCACWWAHAIAPVIQSIYLGIIATCPSFPYVAINTSVCEGMHAACPVMLLVCCSNAHSRSRGPWQQVN